MEKELSQTLRGARGSLYAMETANDEENFKLLTTFSATVV